MTTKTTPNRVATDTSLIKNIKHSGILTWASLHSLYDEARNHNCHNFGYILLN